MSWSLVKVWLVLVIESVLHCWCWSLNSHHTLTESNSRMDLSGSLESSWHFGWLWSAISLPAQSNRVISDQYQFTVSYQWLSYITIQCIEFNQNFEHLQVGVIVCWSQWNDILRICHLVVLHRIQMLFCPLQSTPHSNNSLTTKVLLPLEKSCRGHRWLC